MRVDHPEGLEDALAYVFIERLPRYAFDECTQDIGVIAVDPGFARRVDLGRAPGSKVTLARKGSG
jgi:hypothetical protein